MAGGLLLIRRDLFSGGTTLHRFWLIAGLAAFPTQFSGPASAGLDFCNETSATRSVAIAYSENKRWTSEGWWIVKSGECKTLVKGDLKQRYYYYRATARGATFKGAGFFFCTDPKPFTIVGDKDCGGRGYGRANFRKIDTGKSSKSFELTLTGKTSAPKVKAPGTYGEPATVTGIFRGCREKYGVEFCEIEGQEWVYVVPKDERTPESLYQSLEALDLGRTVTIEGDIVGHGDVTADIVARTVTPGAAQNSSQSRETLFQGAWRSLDDQQSQIRFDIGNYYSYYGGELLDRGTYRFAGSCGTGDGPSLVVTIDGDPEPLCYGIARIDGDRLELIYAARGNTLSYERTRQ